MSLIVVDIGVGSGVGNEVFVGTFSLVDINLF